MSQLRYVCVFTYRHPGTKKNENLLATMQMKFSFENYAFTLAFAHKLTPRPYPYIFDVNWVVLKGVFSLFVSVLLLCHWYCILVVHSHLASKLLGCDRFLVGNTVNFVMSWHNRVARYALGCILSVQIQHVFWEN